MGTASLTDKPTSMKAPGPFVGFAWVGLCSWDFVSDVQGNVRGTSSLGLPLELSSQALLCLLDPKPSPEGSGKAATAVLWGTVLFCGALSCRIGHCPWGGCNPGE